MLGCRNFPNRNRLLTCKYSPIGARVKKMEKKIKSEFGEIWETVFILFSLPPEISKGGFSAQIQMKLLKRD